MTDNFKTCGVSLDTVFKFAPNTEDAACVDLDGEWSEQAKVFRHPDFDEEDIVFMSGEVGEGGDHVNINLKNVGTKEIVIAGDKLVAFIDENPDAVDPNLSKKKDSNTPVANSSEESTTDDAAEYAKGTTTKVAEASMEIEKATVSKTKAGESSETHVEKVNGEADVPSDDLPASVAVPSDDLQASVAVPSDDLSASVAGDDEAMEVDHPESEKIEESSVKAQDQTSSNKVDVTEKDSSEKNEESKDADIEENVAANEKGDSVEMEIGDNSRELSNDSQSCDTAKVDDRNAQETEAEDKTSETQTTDTDKENETSKAVVDMEAECTEKATQDEGSEKLVEKKVLNEASTETQEADAKELSEETTEDSSKKPPEKALEKPTSGDSDETSEKGSEKKSDEITSEKPSDDATSEKREKASSEKPSEEATSEKPSDEASPEKPSDEATSEKPSDEAKSEKQSDEATSKKPSEKATSEKPSDEGSEDASKKDDDSEKSEDGAEKKKSPPPIMMRFVNETEADENEMEEDEDRAETPEDAQGNGNDDAKSTSDSVHTEVQVKEEGDKKPTLKLSSFANLKKQESPVKTKANKGGCNQCQSTNLSLRTAVVWEAMQFCSIACLSTYQTSMSRCSSCNMAVNSQLLGKYCVRFGSDIKQFCSNACLEDYKKGLKVCSYCQKDISGGEGFLAPIGNKGQFKDFCDQNCLHRFQELNKLRQPEQEVGDCQVCKENGPIGFFLIREGETIKFCAKDSCISAYKFANKVEAEECKNCKKCFDEKVFNFPIYCEGGVSWYCSQACQNVAIMISRKITPCTQCRVKKYNFDMIEVYEDSSSSDPNMYCSLHCRTVLKQTEQASKSGSSSVPVISDIFSNAPFSGGVGGGSVPSLPKQPLPPNQLSKTGSGMAQPPPLQQMGQLPVSIAVHSGQLAHHSMAPGGHPGQMVAPAPVQPPPPQIQIQQQTVTEVVKEVKVLPPEVAEVKNKGLQTKPYMVTKGVSCKPMSVSISTQTEGTVNPTIIPIPIPIHMPTPCAMYNMPYPVLVPVPLPFPVPVFIPTTRNSMKGIMKQIKKIQNKIPADPFEAELLALAGNIAQEDKDSSESEYDEYDDDEGRGRHPVPQEPIPDLENDMTAERIIPKPLPTSTPEPPPPRQFNFGGYPSNKRGREEGESDDETWRPQNLFDQRQPASREPARQPQRRQRGRSTQQVKRQRTDSVQPSATPAIPQQPKERPDAHHHLKFTYGVNAWKHWVVGKNAELEKQRAQGKYQKSFETDILKLRADELNFTLCMFVKEVKKPNGDNYAADSILYLVLGIQEYLFENGRIDNIFTDVYYDPFTTALHEVVKEFKLPVNELGYFVTRIEEEHLWESKQLGAHSPQVLLNTLVYFNTKYFQLKTPDEHLKLSFSHIMKHWKKTTITKAGEQQRTVLLRYYPPPQKGQKNEDRKMYEQHENTENPLRCPVKLYEFYLSKCPESTKNRNDMFYLQPERSCVPDSPVWYSQALLNKFSMEKMLARLLMVREVQEHMLAD